MPNNPQLFWLFSANRPWCQNELPLMDFVVTTCIFLVENIYETENFQNDEKAKKKLECKNTHLVRLSPSFMQNDAVLR